MSYSRTYSGVVPAAADKVFDVFTAYFEFSVWGTGIIEKVENLTKDKGAKEIGAVRVFNGVFKEELVALDSIERVIKYQILEAPGTPVADNKNFINTIKVTPIDADSSFLQWVVNFDSEEAKAEAALAFADGAYSTFVKNTIASFSS